VETFLQTRNSGNKDTNYMLAILDSRMKFVAHERFQYVLLKKFGEYHFILGPDPASGSLASYLSTNDEMTYHFSLALSNSRQFRDTVRTFPSMNWCTDSEQFIEESIIQESK
jgi:hypothetical protein